MEQLCIKLYIDNDNTDIRIYSSSLNLGAPFINPVTLHRSERIFPFISLSICRSENISNEV
jgi:hypothetical protein